MLVLSRKINESIVVGEDVVIKLVKIRGNVVSLGIQAPSDVKIMRFELLATEKQSPEVAPKLAQASTSSGLLTIAG